MADDIANTPLLLHTDDGLAIEAEIAETPTEMAVAVLAHPHPLHGGDMRSLVTSELFRTLPHRGISCIRFNFRGVGNSEGDHDGGGSEALDVAAAVEAFGSDHADVPLLLVGWSFGADVSLTVTDTLIAAWCPVAPPLRVVEPASMKAAEDARPKLLVVPEHDQFNPPERAREVVAGWTATEVVTISGGDHFLVGRTQVVVDHVVDLAQSLD